MSIGAVVVALGLVLGLGACGVKSSPRVPEGTTYPKQYPYAGPQSQSSSPAPGEAGDETKESGSGQRTPTGFPLEYPNRRSY